MFAQRDAEVQVSCEGCPYCSASRKSTMDGRRGHLTTMAFSTKSWRWKDENGQTHTCPEENLEVVKEVKETPYWGPSQDHEGSDCPGESAEAEAETESDQAEKAPPPKPAISVAEDFGYGIACVSCRAGRGEEHAPECAFEGTLETS